MRVSLRQDGSTPLHTAAMMGHTAIVEALLGADAGVDHQDEVRTSAAALDVSTAFDGVSRRWCSGMCYAEGGRPWGLQEGRTALHNAAQSGHLATVKLLLAAGAKVNGRQAKV